jgi:hypothetical protein
MICAAADSKILKERRELRKRVIEIDRVEPVECYCRQGVLEVLHWLEVLYW